MDTKLRERKLNVLVDLFIIKRELARYHDVTPTQYVNEMMVSNFDKLKSPPSWQPRGSLAEMRIRNSRKRPTGPHH